jgi:thiosulfate/3-mercaptopyruvate sulfurtransferase
MGKLLIHWLFTAMACTLLALPAIAAAPIVSVEWLQKNLGREDVLVIDASPGQLHRGKGHIPGAVNVDVFTFGGREIPIAEMEQRIQSWGVGPEKKVVLYDQGGTYLATSLFFDLYYHGFAVENLAVLDGGLAKWTAAGGAVTKDATPAPRPGTFKVTKLREDARVRLPEFLVASGDPAHSALVEALDPAQHFGGAKFFDRAGHIPNAIMAPAVDFFNADKTFKSPQEIARMLAYLGITPDKNIYSHCGGGIAASVPFFAAKFMLDYPKVKLYKESQLEWLRDDRGLPFWTYDAPNQLREKAWLAGWGSQMMRQFNVSRLSVVDVRPAAAFKASHVPFAINVPGEVIRGNFNDPAKLAEVLGAAGVDPTHEAVIVSDRGITPDSALAFVALERIGQKRISILADSVDDWAFAGYPVTKANDAADAKKAPAAPAPRAYPVSLRSGVVVSDPTATQGVYPKIYIASGKTMPSRLPDGKVVHVPYTDLLEANGTPKAAKDIWAVLTKAGVPRYAELVSIADEPGEAAANYFILKLMGYPDVKVLVM